MLSLKYVAIEDYLTLFEYGLYISHQCDSDPTYVLPHEQQSVHDFQSTWIN